MKRVLFGLLHFLGIFVPERLLDATRRLVDESRHRQEHTGDSPEDGRDAPLHVSDGSIHRYDLIVESPEGTPVPVKTLIARDPLVVHWGSLTRRQQDVVALVCLGHRNPEIAQILNLSPHTVRGYLEDIFPKLGVQSRTEIRLRYRDWDFQSWWMNRESLPLESPAPAPPPVLEPAVSRRKH
jgi:DNA-binding CsgD family transcriptional regulator